MRKSLSIVTVSLSVSPVLAVVYIVLMLASLVLVDMLTTGSWQAVCLGIGWSIITGFEIDFLGVGTVSFAIALKASLEV